MESGDYCPPAFMCHEEMLPNFVISAEQVQFEDEKQVMFWPQNLVPF